MHARQQIRDAVVTALTGNVGVGVSVIGSRTWILQTDELPLVGVYTASEASTVEDELAAMGAPTLARTLELVCEVAVIGVDGEASANQLDDISELIEDEMAGNRNIVGVVDILPVSNEVEQLQEGDRIISRGLITFDCLYRTAVGASGVIV